MHAFERRHFRLYCIHHMNFTVSFEVHSQGWPIETSPQSNSMRRKTHGKKLFSRVSSQFFWSPSSRGDAPPAIVDTSAPTVSSVIPLDSATAVPINGYVTATFSEAMKPDTITVGTFTVVGTTAAAGAVTLNAAGTTAIFTPTANLAGNTVYTATITTGAPRPSRQCPFEQLCVDIHYQCDRNGQPTSRKPQNGRGFRASLKIRHFDDRYHGHYG